MVVAPGLLLADWDETKGPVVIQFLLPDIVEPPEVLAAQMYVSAQNVFSSEQFSEISFCLPLLKVKRKVKIFFNYVEDTNVRGGRRPFIFCVFLELETLDTTFEKVDDVIEGEIADYRNGKNLNLSAIQTQVVNCLKTPKKIPSQEVAAEVPEGETEVPSEDLTILKVFCEKCSKAIRINIDKDKMPKPERIPFTFTYLHGGKSPAGRHGIELKLDGNLAILGITYVDRGGHADVSVEEGVDLRKIRWKVGPWQPEEMAFLRAEVKKGTPSHRLSRLLSRTIRDIETKIEQLK
ncbi:MAG: hypothetical protein RBG13Loki_2217 [Promethearchaeota archaeon CR_4]|nr:MAG: hypothetical protein RBG13Loki_2217 [Candidatus Lokiarchaeota archaeon CR_4]